MAKLTPACLGSPAALPFQKNVEAGQFHGNYCRSPFGWERSLVAIKESSNVPTRDVKWFSLPLMGRFHFGCLFGLVTPAQTMLIKQNANIILIYSYFFTFMAQIVSI